MKKNKEEERAQGKLERVTLSGLPFKKSVTIRIYTPPFYNPPLSHHVIYLFDGERLFFEDENNYTSWRVDESLEKNQSPLPFIVVGIDYSSSKELDYLPLVNNLLLDNVERQSSAFQVIENLLGTIIPFVEMNYQVGSNKVGRTIGGSSMGGLLALYALSRFPDIFDNGFLFSPALFVYKTDNKEIYGERLLELFKSNHQLKRIFCSVGGVGFEAQFVDEIKKFAKIFQEPGFEGILFNYQSDKKFEHDEMNFGHFFNLAFRFLIKNIN